MDDKPIRLVLLVFGFFIALIALTLLSEVVT